MIAEEKLVIVLAYEMAYEASGNVVADAVFTVLEVIEDLFPIGVEVSHRLVHQFASR